MAVIERAVAPNEAEKRAIAELLALCAAADGSAELSLEKSLNRDPTMESWFFAWEGGEGARGPAAGSPALLGLISVFAPRAEEAEISGFVRPEARRKGLFTELLAAAEKALAPRGFADELLVVDRLSADGAAFAKGQGAVLVFSEYGLAHPGPAGLPAEARAGLPTLVLERATEADTAALVDILAGAFGDTRENEEAMVRASLASKTREQYLARVGGRAVGAVSITREADFMSINGLAVGKDVQGRGYGRAIVLGCLEEIWKRGAAAKIEVDSSNDKAYRLYLGSGFRVERAVDYWRRPFPAAD
jgi:ribosomal protein S18 acetylase RimI-like enzyme